MDNHILAQVHFLPTEETNPTLVKILHLPQKNKFYSHVAGGEFRRALQMGHKPYHLYFTSDEETKENDCVLHESTNNIIFPARKEDLGRYNHFGSYKKIIATTDSSIYEQTYDIAVKSIRPPAKIPNDFIEFFVKEYNKNRKIEELWLEQTTVALCNQRFYESEYKHDWFTIGKEYTVVFKGPFDKLYVENDCGAEVAINKEWFTFTDKLKLNSDGSVVWKIKEEKIYTREELITIANNYGKECYREGFTGEIRTTIDEWINKKHPKT